MDLFKEKLLGKIFIFTGIMSLLYFLAAVLSKLTFAVFFAVLGIVLILFGLVKMYVKQEVLMNRFGWLVYIFRVTMIVGIISFVIIEGLIIYNGTKKEVGQFDYVIVLGAMVRGETPSLILYERLNTSLIYVKENPNVKIILSGAKGVGENISEAEAMERYFIKNGIDKNRLIKEEKSTSTMENLKFSSEIIKKLEHKESVKVLIVTNDFHVFRAKFLARRNSLNAEGLSASTMIGLKPAYYVREYFALIKSFVFDKN